MTYPLGEKARVVDRNVQHYGKVGVVVPNARWMGAWPVLNNGVTLRFEGDQRAWLDAGEAYTVSYATVQVESVTEEVQVTLW